MIFLFQFIVSQYFLALILFESFGHLHDGVGGKDKGDTIIDSARSSSCLRSMEGSAPSAQQ